MWLSISPEMSAWWLPKWPSSASRSAGSLRRSAPLASSARTAGSWVPVISASSIARPDTPRTRLATEESLMPASSSTLCRALHLTAAFLDERLAIASQVAQLADRRRRHEARSHQTVLDELGDPLGVLDVGPAPLGRSSGAGR